MMLSGMHWPQEPSGALAERESEFSVGADDRNHAHRPPSFAAAHTIATIPVRRASGNWSQASMTAARTASG